MAVSYKKLWKMLIDRDMKKKELCAKAGISTSSLTKMGKGGHVTTEVLNIGFEDKLWQAACELWGHIPATEYRQIIIGLIFLRYISNAFDKKHQELVDEGEGF